MQKGMLSLALLLSLSTLAAAQMDKSKRPSPPAQTECKFSDGKAVHIDYSSPRAKGRKVFGGLIPYGQVWRAGANEATTFVATANVKVGDKDVPAGNYTLFTIPNQDKWTLIVSKKTGEWGVPYPGEGEDFTRTDMSVSKTPSMVENFAINFAQQGDKCTLQMDWENTRASIDVSEKK